MDEACVFCRILEGELPASFVYRDATVAAFMDIQPVNAGHLLVIPTTHVAYLSELAPDDGAAVFETGRRLAGAVRDGSPRCDAVNLLLADGAEAGQEIFHTHLHVVPRFTGDGFGFRFPPSYFDQPERAALDDLAQRIRAALE